MCLAVPAKLLSTEGEEPIFRMGQISVGGTLRTVSLAYVPEARVGDYVLVHAGFAISTIDEKEARQVFEYLKEIVEPDDAEDETSG